jgi:hypothetical protein
VAKAALLCCCGNTGDNDFDVNPDELEHPPTALKLCCDLERVATTKQVMCLESRRTDGRNEITDYLQLLKMK